jgi:hypothetical protein
MAYEDMPCGVYAVPPPGTTIRPILKPGALYLPLPRAARLFSVALAGGPGPYRTSHKRSSKKFVARERSHGKCTERHNPLRCPLKGRSVALCPEKRPLGTYEAWRAVGATVKLRSLQCLGNAYHRPDWTGAS